MAEATRQAEKDEITPPLIQPTPVVEQETTVRTDDGGAAHIRMVWVHEVVDLSKVPRRYLELDERAVKADIKAGIREIEGLKIYEEPKSVFRT